MTNEKEITDRLDVIERELSPLKVKLDASANTKAIRRYIDLASVRMALKLSEDVKKLFESSASASRDDVLAHFRQLESQNSETREIVDNLINLIGDR